MVDVDLESELAEERSRRAAEAEGRRAQREAQEREQVTRDREKETHNFDLISQAVSIMQAHGERRHQIRFRVPKTERLPFLASLINAVFGWSHTAYWICYYSWSSGPDYTDSTFGSQIFADDAGYIYVGPRRKELTRLRYGAAPSWSIDDPVKERLLKLA